MSRSKIFLLFFTILFAWACNKKLDVQPQNSVTPDQITTAEDVTALVFGAYSTLQNANAFGESYNTVTELLFDAGNIDWAGTFAQYVDLHQKQTTVSNSLIYQVWANSYQTINVVNLALSKLDLLDEEDRAAIEGECRFLRGLVYFQLVNMYAKPYSAENASAPGVPIVLEAVAGYDPERDKRPRASVEEVYTQILSDITFAIDNLPEEAEDYRASKTTASALLSRVYLAQLKYEEAAAAANDVIESEMYALAPSVTAAFNNVASSSEDIFAIQQNSQSNSGTSNFGMIAFYASYPVGRGEIQVTEEFVEQFEASDARGRFVLEGESISGSVGLLTRKWSEPYKAIPVIRLAEMYLTRAEGNLRSSSQVGPNTPLEDVNLVRRRAGASLLGSATADDIVNERLLELAFEGERFLTMKRLQMNVGNIPYNDPKLVLPIPERETDLGNALPQNDGYQ